MRLIDADELDYELGTSDRDIYVRKCLQDAPTITLGSLWIPCSERLPETTDAVLTTYIVNGDRSKRYVEESSYYGNDESWSSPWDEYRVAGTRIEVIAWMPLPEEYRGE